MMFSRVVVALAVALLGLSGVRAADEKDTRVYEMRIYTAPPSKLADLEARFRNHTVKLFEKHGMTNVAYWVPIDNKQNQLIYILAYPSRKARETSWKKFVNDPDWKKVRKETEAKGPIVSKVEQIFLTTTDYSPRIKPAKGGDRVFELRTYTASPGNLENLNARFRNHTLKLFEKHGMTNIGYWVRLKGEKGADNTLIYIIAHKSEAAARESFAAFRKDPAWLKVRRESEEKAGGSLTTKDGVKSQFLKATDYSPIQ